MKLLLCGILLVFCVFSFGQNDYPYGKFPVRTIDKSEYNNGGVQNWDIIQNNDNFIYVANNAGILEYNGSSWFKFTLENKEHPRSFGKNDKGEIFVGGKNEFGVIRYNEKGKPFCEKLSGPVDSIDFKEIWQLKCIDDKTYFFGRQHIFVYDGSGEIETIPVLEGQELRCGLKTGDKILVSCKNEPVNKIYVLEGSQLTKVQSNDTVVAVSGYSQNGVDYVIDQTGQFYSLISNGGKYRLDKIEHLYLKSDERIDFTTIGINEKFIVVSSVEKGGIQVYDRKGNSIRELNDRDDLKNLRINNVMFDQFNNLWTCNDNGISFIELSSALTTFDSKDGINAGVIEDIFFKNSDILLANHTDIYTSYLEQNRIAFISKNIFDMEVFQVKEFTFSDGNKMTLAVINDGIAVLDENLKGSIIPFQFYAWDMCQSISNPDRIYFGLDGDGIGSMRYENGTFINEGYYNNTSGEVRSVLEKDGKLYYTVKNDGVHLLDTTKSQDETKLPGLENYDNPEFGYEQFVLCEFQNKIYLGTRNGLYEINGNSLEQSKLLNGEFLEKQLMIHRIFNDDNQKLWMVLFHDAGTDYETSEIGYLKDVDGEKQWVSAPFNQINDVIFSVKKAENGIYWLGGVKGLYAYNDDVANEITGKFDVFINRIYLNREDIYMYHTNYAKPIEHILSYDQNTVSFEFGSTAYLGKLTNEYSYYLQGEEDSWSKWSSNQTVEFQRLGEGDYVFHLKSKNFYDVESEEVTFAFTISPPWYRTWWAYLIYFLLAILLIYVIIRLSVRRVKAQNERLEEIVVERTAEIAEQNSKLEHQKAEIQEKTNDILDSIKYAERIQTAILPPEDEMAQLFDGEHFVLFKPKDIVSGDFYWAERFGSQAIFSAVDCTGHGVPGAFVSIVGFNGLNRTVNEFDLRKPGEILDKLTELVVETFSKSESQIKDGMDIALCNINYETNILTYAGANNPLIMIRNNEIIEIKANKQPIGEFENRVPFTTHEIKLEKGDCIYVYSDGYADQFGGPKGKKFKGKALKDLLLKLNDLPMKEQRTKINQIFEEWKGSFEQLDDVCLIGVRIL